MGRWSTARRRCSAAIRVPGFALPPPIVEDDWDAFDGESGDFAEFQVVIVDATIPPGADALGVRYRELAGPGVWEGPVFCTLLSQFINTGIEGVQYQAQAAWFLAGVQVSEWGPNLVTVVTGT